MRVGRTLAVLVMLAALSGCAWIDRSSVASRPAATEGNGPSGEASVPVTGPSISQSGRYVAFTSSASNLVPDDTNGKDDVFVHDHVSGSTERVSVGTQENQGDTDSFDPSISDDGRYVAFSTTTGQFNNPPTSGQASRIFVRDRQLGTTTPVFGGTGSPGHPVISGNGRFVAYVGGGETPFSRAVTPPFVFDLLAGTSKPMPVPDSLDSGRVYDGARPSLSDDGSRITYSHIVPSPTMPDRAGTITTVVVDTATATVIETLRAAMIVAPHQTRWVESAISGDGTTVALLVSEGQYGTLYTSSLARPGLWPIVNDISRSSNLRISDDGGVIGFRRDDAYVITDPTGLSETVVSASNVGRPEAALSGNVDLSGDGKWIAFGSPDAGLVANDTNAVSDVFLRSTGFEMLPPS